MSVRTTDTSSKGFGPRKVYRGRSLPFYSTQKTGARLLSIVLDGLVLNLDAGNTNSYPGSGTTWYDLSGNGRNLTLYNGTAHNADGYFDFDGVDDYAQTSDNGLGTGSDIPHTLEMWVNFDTLTLPRWWLAVIGQYSTGAHHWISQFTDGTGTAFGVWDGSVGCQSNLPLVGVNSWMHLVGTSDGTTLTYYVNNISTGGTSCSSFNFTNTNFSIGLRVGTEGYFNGKVAISRIYNRALTAAEVQQNYNALVGRFSP